jgi:arylsulfatase
MVGLAARSRSTGPILVKLRLDPFERTGLNQSVYAANWWGNEFWRFVYVQDQVSKLAETAIDFPPMQKGASFNLEAVKAQVEAAMKAAKSPGAN